MLCPYRLKSKTELQLWEQTPDDNQTITDGKTGTKTLFEYAECKQHDCGAFYQDKCNFNNNED